MGGPRPAEFEERAELRALREQARATGREVGDTMAVLAARLAKTANPRAWVRRKAAQARAEARRVMRRPVWAGRARVTAVAVVPAGIIVIAVAAMVWQRRRQA